MTRFWQLLLALAIVLCSGCACYDKTTESYDQMNVPFGVFDMYKPTCTCVSQNQPALKPAVILIHGGAWQGGDKKDMHKVAEELVKHGYVCFSPNYRVTADGPDWKGTPWPAQYDDLKKFLVYLRANAGRYGVDRDKIASLGISAGGHLAQMLHLRDPEVRTVTAIDLDGETDLRPPGNTVMAHYGDIMQLAGGVQGVTPASWEDPKARNEKQQLICLDMSTVPLVTKDSKILIIHGESDDNIYVDQADRLAIALKSVGADYDYVRLSGKAGFCHGNCWQDDKALTRLLAWLDRHLR